MNYFNMEIPDYIKEELSRKMSNNSIAEESFYKGKTIISKITSIEVVEEAMALFKKASDIDVNFIEAKAEFGLCYRLFWRI